MRPPTCRSSTTRVTNMTPVLREARNLNDMKSALCEESSQNALNNYFQNSIVTTFLKYF